MPQATIGKLLDLSWIIFVHEIYIKFEHNEKRFIILVYAYISNNKKSHDIAIIHTRA